MIEVLLFILGADAHIRPSKTDEHTSPPTNISVSDGRDDSPATKIARSLW